MQFFFADFVTLPIVPKYQKSLESLKKIKENGSLKTRD